MLPDDLIVFSVQKKYPDFFGLFSMFDVKISVDNLLRMSAQITKIELSNSGKIISLYYTFKKV